MRIVLDLDDFSDKDNCRTELWPLSNYFYNFKINMFTVTMDTSISTLHDFEHFGCVYYPHGIVHGYLELDNISYEDMMKHLEKIDLHRRSGLLGRVYKAPYWRYSEGCYRALVDYDYVVAVSREQVPPPSYVKKIYEYDYELDEPWYDSNLEVVRLHGHTTPYRNSLDLFYRDLMQKLPRDTEFLTIEQYLDEKGVDAS